MLSALDKFALSFLSALALTLMSQYPGTDFLFVFGAHL